MDKKIISENRDYEIHKIISEQSPYGLKAIDANGVVFDVESCSCDSVRDIYGKEHQLSYVLPLLRPKSSMTNDEKNELKNLLFECMELQDDSANIFVSRWYYSKHFDLLGWIPKGWAVDAKDAYAND